MAQEEKNPLFSERVREQLLHQRILVLDGVLDDDNGTLLATQLLTLAAGDPAADIALWIHSPGGSVPAMLAIRRCMRLVPCDVSTLALGLACSAGQFLLSAGAAGKRSALPHARILMHRGSAGIGGSAVDIEVQADDLRFAPQRIRFRGLGHSSGYERTAASGEHFAARATAAQRRRPARPSDA